jgi:hypothetical protein
MYGNWACWLRTNPVPAVVFDLSDDRRRLRLLMVEHELAKIR